MSLFYLECLSSIDDYLECLSSIWSVSVLLTIVLSVSLLFATYRVLFGTSLFYLERTVRCNGTHSRSLSLSRSLVRTHTRTHTNLCTYTQCAHMREIQIHALKWAQTQTKTRTLTYSMYIVRDSYTHSSCPRRQRHAH